jgi:hypothetical protein
MAKKLSGFCLLIYATVNKVVYDYFVLLNQQFVEVYFTYLNLPQCDASIFIYDGSNTDKRMDTISCYGSAPLRYTTTQPSALVLYQSSSGIEPNDFTAAYHLTLVGK